MANGAILGQTANTYSKEQIMASTVPPLFGLGSDAVPSNLFQILSQAALYKTVTPTAQLDTLPEGSIIYLNENGTPVPFYVAKQDYEPDYNTDRVLVVRREASQQGTWSSSINTYNGSTIDTWFNQTYLLTLDENVRSLVGTTNIPVTSPYNSGVTRVNKSVFALSVTELGRTSTIVNTEGSTLPIADELAIFSPSQWTRSPVTNGNGSAMYISGNGVIGSGFLNENHLYRPAFTLPSDFVVTVTPTTTGLYDVFDNLLMKLPGVQIATGSYTGTGTYGASNPNSLTFEFEPKILIVQTNGPAYTGAYAVFVRNSNSAITIWSDGLSVFVSGWGSKTIKWYNNNNVYGQLNESGAVHNYLAIG